MNSGPQSTRIPKREASMIGTIVRRLWGQVPGAPSGVFDQSMERMSAALSLFPGKGSSSASPPEPAKRATRPEVYTNFATAGIARSDPREGSEDGSNVGLALPDAAFLLERELPLGEVAGGDDHVGALRHRRDEIPERVVGGARLALPSEPRRAHPISA